ncbi:dentin sialophosphoprotein isoform X1 [Neodiprion pinetum]|uniref:dentin sialophosphoprotein isoform X1 n=2 Tax=Neodiprion pinetum TaxID=441929 RepID=UPI001EDCD312|nr:uncharacterized protein LOC124217458 isoform X1 [Neodiprion pinetum]
MRMPRENVTESVDPGIVPSSEDTDNRCASIDRARMKPSTSFDSDNSSRRRNSSRSSPESSDSEQTSSDDEYDSENEELSDNTQVSGMAKGLKGLNLNSARTSTDENAPSDGASDSESDSSGDEIVARGPNITRRASKKRSEPYHPNDRGRIEGNYQSTLNLLDHTLQEAVGSVYKSDPVLFDGLVDKLLCETNSIEAFGNDYNWTPGNLSRNMATVPDIHLEQSSPNNFSLTPFQWEGFPSSPSTSQICDTPNHSPEGSSSHWNPDESTQYLFHNSPINNMLTSCNDKWLPNGNSVETQSNSSGKQFFIDSPGSDYQLESQVLTDFTDAETFRNLPPYNALPSPGPIMADNTCIETKVLNCDYGNNENTIGIYHQVPNISSSPTSSDTNGSLPSPIHNQTTLKQISMTGTNGGAVTYSTNHHSTNQQCEIRFDSDNTWNSTKSMRSKNLPPTKSSQTLPRTEGIFQTPRKPAKFRATTATRKEPDYVACLKTPTIPGCDSLMENVSNSAASEAASEMMDWKESYNAAGDSTLMALIRNLKPDSKPRIVALVRKMKTRPETFSYKNRFGHDALYLAAIFHPELPELSRFIAEAWIQSITNSTIPIDIQPTRYDTHDSDTLLHLLAAKGDSHANILKELVSVGSSMFDVSAINIKGKIPLHVAVECHSEEKSTVEICRLLYKLDFYCDIEHITLEMLKKQKLIEVFLGERGSNTSSTGN